MYTVGTCWYLPQYCGIRSQYWYQYHGTGTTVQAGTNWCTAIVLGNTQTVCDRMRLIQSFKELTTFLREGLAFKQRVLNRLRFAGFATGALRVADIHAASGGSNSVDRGSLDETPS